MVWPRSRFRAPFPLLISVLEQPVRAYVGFPGKTLFARLRDKRVYTYRADHAGEIDPDIVVLPCSQVSKFSLSDIDLPPRAAIRLQNGSALLVLDASLEGQPHSDTW